MGLLPAWAGAPHHVALPPFDVMADGRVLVARAPNWPALIAASAAVVALRSGLMIVAVGGLSRRRARWVVTYYLAVLPLALALAALGYAAVVLLYSLFLWLAAAVALVSGALLAPWPWRAVPWPRAAGAVVGYVVALMGVSAVASQGGSAARMAAAWASAALTVGCIALLSGHRVVLPRRPAAGALALLMAGACLVSAAPVTSQPGERPGSLFLVPGVGGSSGTATMFELEPRDLGFTCARTRYFSYAGPGPGAPQRRSACPIRTGAPYGPGDTSRPLDELVPSLRGQMADLPRPVTVVAHSQGAWLTMAALRAHQPPAVDAMVLLAPFPTQALSYGPQDGSRPGSAGDDVMRALLTWLRRGGHTSFDPDAALPRRLLGTPDAVTRLMRKPPGGVPTVAATSAYDLAVLPEGWQMPGATDLCPLVHHGWMPSHGPTLAAVGAFLDGSPPRPCPLWRRWAFGAGQAFGVPPS